jgi:hypothetical protein
MKRFVSPILAAALAIGLASFATAADLSSWTGTVTDSKCAEKGAAASHADCAVKCVKEKGAKWALYNPTTKETYVLAGKEDPTKFAGKEVTVKGTLNKDTKTIECTSIEAKK